MKKNPNKIMLLGCGALGSNIALNLSFDRREDELVLIDHDLVEPRNYQFGTQQYFPEQEGQLKVNALQFNLHKIARKTQGVEIVNKKIPPIPPISPNSLIIDCFDNYEARELIREYAEKEKLDCLHVGFSPMMTFEIQWNEGYKTPDDTKSSFDICELEGSRSFIQYVSGIATTTIIDFLKTGRKRNFVGNRFSCREVL